jgi:hypothetical protein
METAAKVGLIFERILKEVDSCNSHTFYFALFCVHFQLTLIYSVIYVVFQTVKLRDEQEHDMPLQQAISMVLERHPDLKYVYCYNMLPLNYSFDNHKSVGCSIIA